MDADLRGRNVNRGLTTILSLGEVTERFSLQYWTLPCKSCMHDITVDFKKYYCGSKFKILYRFSQLHSFVDAKLVFIPCRVYSRGEFSKFPIQ